MYFCYNYNVIEVTLSCNTIAVSEMNMKDGSSRESE